RVRGRDGHLMTITDGVEGAIDWIDHRLAHDGYICVQRTQPNGLRNQTWEHSYDSHFRGDGHLLDPEVPYAPVAVQGLAYDALLIGARLASKSRRASHLEAIAAMLRRKVIAEFWLPELETLAPALVLNGSRPRPVRIAASSPG